MRARAIAAARLAALAWLVGGGIWASVGGARAELPPRAYEAMRQSARYVLVLAVESVERAAPRTDGPFRTTTVVVRARIVSVIRGAGLKMGDTVTIRYRHREPVKPGWVGPAPIPVLEKGSRVLAWLNRGEGAFAPAARGHSFATLR